MIGAAVVADGELPEDGAVGIVARQARGPGFGDAVGDDGAVRFGVRVGGVFVHFRGAPVGGRGEDLHAFERGFGAGEADGGGDGRVDGNGDLGEL